MKIINAKVEDPGRRGFGNKPKLNVWVDEALKPTGEIVQRFTRDLKGYYRFQHYGPFVRYLFYDNTPDGKGGALGGEDGWPSGAWSSRAGAFNVEVKPDKQIIDVGVYLPDWPNLAVSFGLEIDRAQSLLRKYDPEWRLGLDEDAARQGDITWVPEEYVPSCLHMIGGMTKGSPCLQVAVYPAFGRPLGVCPQHKAEHDVKQVAARTSGRRG